MPKVDKVEYQRRIYEVQSWIINGVPTALIIRNIIEKQWYEADKEKDQKRSAERILREARIQWTETEDAEFEQKRRIKISQLEQQKLSLKSEYRGTPEGIKTLLAIDKEIILLEGLRKTQKQIEEDIGPPIEKFARLNDTQFNKLLNTINNYASTSTG